MIFKKYIPKSTYYLSGGFWLTIPQLLISALAFISTVFIANILSEQELGVYRYLITIFTLVSTFCLTGLNNAILQTTAKGHEGFYPYAVRKNFLFSIFATVVSLLLSAYYFLNGNFILGSGCLLTAVLTPFNTSFQFASAFFQGKEQFALSSRLISIRSIVITGSVVATAYITADPLAIFAVYLISQTISNATFHRKAMTIVEDKELPETVKNKFSNYAKHLSVQNLIIALGYRLDALLIFTQLGSAQLATYVIATLFPDLIKGLSKNIFPLLMIKHSTIKVVYTKKYIFVKMLMVFLVLTFVALAYILVIPYLLPILFPKYESAIWFTQLIALSIPALCSLIPYNVLHTNHDKKALHVVALSASVTTGILALVLIPLYGIIGAVFAKITSRYLVTIVTTFYALKSVSVEEKISN